MKLKKIKLLSKFRGLPKGYQIEFNTENTSERKIEPICFVGLNGSGKSNILELIAEIFYYLEIYSRINKKSNELAYPFGFHIEYFLPRIIHDENSFPSGRIGNLSIENLNGHRLVQIIKKPNELPTGKVLIDDNIVEFSHEKTVDFFSMVLPKSIIGYTSGLNELLSNPFIKMDLEYSDELKRKANEAARATLDLNRLFFLNYNSSKIFAISNFIFDDTNLAPLKDELDIKDLLSFSIHLKLEKEKHKKDYLPSELNQAIYSFQELDPLFSEKESSTTKVDRLEYTFNFQVDGEKKQAFQFKFQTKFNLLRILYNFQMLNIQLIGSKTKRNIRNARAGTRDNLSDIIPKKEKEKLIFSVDSILFEKENGNKVYLKQLSDGEHQLMQIIGSLILLDQQSTLFLFDEPTTHFNPEWRSKFIYLIDKSLEGHLKRKQEILLTTHSPFIISDSKRVNVVRTFNRNGRNYEFPEEETYGASIRFLLNRLFNQKHSIGEFSFQELKKLELEIDSLENEEQAEDIKAKSQGFGDSPEKIKLFNKLANKLNTISKE
ncbi:restriction system-associated AAA family ATPase [Salinimicrobium flavum]|uniref:Restriction system-associated AAA family ATPase n=1 Tax=Salinimicrobium flavum TaxID=1737065 RepID=A0ABW5IZ96_9FLAO